jgi:hypothetical protein
MHIFSESSCRSGMVERPTSARHDRDSFALSSDAPSPSQNGRKVCRKFEIRYFVLESEFAIIFAAQHT